MKSEDLKKGTRIYYNGDMANEEGLGTIVEQKTDKWGTHVNIKMDDGRDIKGLSIVMFSDEYLGHGGTRFVTEEAYKKFRQAAIERVKKSLAQKRILTKSGYCYCEECAECFLNSDNKYDEEEVAEVLYGDDCMGLICNNCGKKE